MSAAHKTCHYSAPCRTEDAAVLYCLRVAMSALACRTPEPER